jgi:hypothetical protein
MQLSQSTPPARTEKREAEGSPHATQQSSTGRQPLCDKTFMA